MKDFKMPVAIITFLAAQAGGMVWFLSDYRVESQHLNTLTQ